MEMTKRVLGHEHPDTLTSMKNLAFTWKGQNRDEEALTLMKHCIQLQKKILGPGHPFTMSTLTILDTWKLEN